MLFASVTPGVTAQDALPSPGIGLLVQAEEMPALRAKLALEPWKSTFANLQKRADALVEHWPATAQQMDERLEAVLDLTIEFDAVTKDQPTRDLVQLLGRTAQGEMCPAAFTYLVTGERKYAEVALDVMRTMGRVNHWGWFTWSGTSMPHIHAGMYARNTAFTLDFIWDALTEAERAELRQLIAEKIVEPYFRLVLHTPAMGLHHLRSKNQGSNVMAGAMISCLALGNDYPQSRQWRRSFIQTFHWLITHDIGWAGQGLESGMPGYWSVSMQNLYTGAVCLFNTTGIDLRSHPGFAEATYYPIMHETTVPPVGMFNKPIDPNYKGATGIIGGKPIELPHPAAGGLWWYDYARRQPKSAAAYFINRTMIQLSDDERLRFYVHDAHQQGHSQIISLLWTDADLYRPNPPAPSELFKTTDRMTMFRSGYGMGETFLYANGDIFLSSLGEILGTTSGMSWHFKWHGYQKAESGVQTEGHNLAPSMLVTDSWDDKQLSMVQTRSSTSNITYYRPAGHDTEYKKYRRRDRDIIYVRDRPGRDYFIVMDHLRHDEPRWHAWLWQTWNSVHGNQRDNPARFTLLADNQVRLERPNADLAIQFVAPADVEFEIEDAPGQPITSYMFDHNLLTLRAMAGKYQPTSAPAVTIPPTAWQGAGELTKPEAGPGSVPASAYQVSGRVNLVQEQGQALNTFRHEAVLRANTRYRMRLNVRKQELSVYENLAWRINLSLHDADGKILAAADSDYPMPDQLALRDPRSITNTTDWLLTEWVHFDVPAGSDVAELRGDLLAAEYSHPPNRIHEDSVLQIGAIDIEPLGVIPRRAEETFLAILSPLRKSAETPAIEVTTVGEAQVARIPRTEFAADWIIVGARKPTEFKWGRVAAEFAWIRVDDNEVVSRVYLRKAELFELEGQTVLTNSGPLDIALSLSPIGTITRARAFVDGATEVSMLGKTYPLGNGVYTAGRDLDWTWDETASSLGGNSLTSQGELEHGLAPLMRMLREERDTVLSRNIALDSQVTASGYRDHRFPPALVTDNKTWEYPTAGRLDYAQQPIKTTQGGGYGREKIELFGDAMAQFPFYVRPTYWLLPHGQPGWVQLKLPANRTVSQVRLLNTSNAGLNDHATMSFRVQLLDDDGNLVSEKKGQFGKVLDRPFEQAFRFPGHFGTYGKTFAGMLEPGVAVPFGDGWYDLDFDTVRARFVKVLIDSHWAIGGGLNEIQVFE